MRETNIGARRSEKYWGEGKCRRTCRKTQRRQEKKSGDPPKHGRGGVGKEGRDKVGIGVERVWTKGEGLHGPDSTMIEATRGPSKLSRADHLLLNLDIPW